MAFLETNYKKILFVVFLGFFLHFAYQIFHQNPFIACFSPVNESVWEHLKLLFIPILLLSLFGKVIYQEQNFYIYFIASFLGMVFTVIAFYTYTGIIGKHYLLLDILIFVLSVVLVFYIKYIARKDFQREKRGVIYLFVMLGIFILFTFFTPHLPLFMDSISGTYGI